jgi:hypothetical protein
VIGFISLSPFSCGVKLKWSAFGYLPEQQVCHNHPLLTISIASYYYHNNFASLRTGVRALCSQQFNPPARLGGYIRNRRVKQWRPGNARWRLACLLFESNQNEAGHHIVL